MARTPAVNIKEGDEVRSNLNGETYLISKIVHSMVVLKSKDREKEVITGMDSLRIFYRMKRDPDSSQRLPNGPPPHCPSENR